MCWSGEASAVLAAAGLAATAYLIKQGEKRELYLPLFYFTMMELLQAVTYIYINQCSIPMNKVLTLLGYTHIAFQPVFINMLAMHFIPVEIKNKISPYVYGVCGIGAGLFLAKAYPVAGTPLCLFGTETFCGPFACSYKGSWHIAWQWPLNNLGSSFSWLEVPAKEYITGEEARKYMFKGNWEYIWQWLRDTVGARPLLLKDYHRYLIGLHAQAYMVCAFILPLLYGSWRMILVTILLGPVIAGFSTSNLNEFAAIWCLYSIALCCTIVKSPLRKHLYVTDWPLYPYIFSWRSKHK
ncbi:MAG: hypothetical protein KBB94_06760 [Legionellaceae bacterium]|nr:hypothetical protein [Legionellaceae bacterium]MBP9775339.1 hypothetical protein [Legionellaceae bacterium]